MQVCEREIVSCNGGGNIAAFPEISHLARRYERYFKANL